MKQGDLQKLFEKALREKGSASVQAALQGVLDHEVAETRILTIIANAGVHEFPRAFLRGEVYEASRGDWDASTQEALLAELTVILSRLVKRLKSQRWDRVYLIPTGHPVLSAQIKTMVYRVLRLNTIDLYYKTGVYFEVNLDQRAIAIAADEGSRA